MTRHSLRITLWLLAPTLATVGLIACSSDTPEATFALAIDGGSSSGSGGSLGSSGSGSGSGSSSGSGSGSGGGSGSSSGGSHDAGVKQPPPVHVTDCNALPEAGTWEQAWLPQSFSNDQNLETTAVTVDLQDQSVYVAAGSFTNGGNSGTGVYASTDCGANFKLVSTGTNAANVAGGDPWVLMDDVDVPDSLYIVVGYGKYGLYKSTDKGVNWKPLTTDPTHTTGGTGQAFVQALSILSSNTSNLVVTFHQNCTSPFPSLCFSQSNDNGATWTAFNGPSLSPGGWQESATISMLGAQTFLFLGAGSGSVSYTNDNGANWSTPSFVDANGGGTKPGVDESYAGSTHVGPDGTLYLGTPSGIFASSGATVGTSWKQLAHSPAASSLADDGTYLYATYYHSGFTDGSTQPFWRAPLADLSKWTNMPSPPIARGGYELAYDPTHHILYSANFGAGLWRLVTQ